MAKKVDSGTVVLSYEIWEYESYFGVGRHAYDVMAIQLESDMLFDSVESAQVWLRSSGKVVSDGV